MEKELNLFEYASKNKLRFNYRGSISTEDLWDLSLEQLDVIYKGLKQESKESEEESLLTARPVNVELTNSIKLVEYIFNKKSEEMVAAKEASAKRAEKQKLLAILASKKEAELQGKSIEELEEMIASLN